MTSPVQQAIREKVGRMSDLLVARDMTIVDELWSPGFRLVGSESGEVAEDPKRLAALFAMLFSRPVSYAFDFPRFEVDVEGTVAWLFAEGDLVATGASGIRRHPYRLTAIFVGSGGDWTWRLFSGSEPAAHA